MSSEMGIHEVPLPGYRLTMRLGAGGYGEVWKAEAPGGLTKAIKFVFGQEHEKRATRELKALELIKQLRHPFLLSLERIEIIDGRLLIVTELADGSIKDRFDTCRRENMPGIPRDELLRYMRDSADALDFMAEAHGLQHLDIKPENLLLLAGHVKVADFGLVKDVSQSQASLVGGMTPLYAAPEVFRGQPSRQSDQYSLAIVFQEMLTGTLPFAGDNAAELTLQHLNDEPDLASLSSADRYVVSRAMSKDPAHRYFTCREFVEALSAAPADDTTAESAGDAPGSSTSGWYRESPRPASSVTELFDDECEASADHHSLVIDYPPTNRAVKDLPPIAVNVGDFQPSPCLVLGIGGTAGLVLGRLRQQLQAQYGNSPLPSLQTLLLDTDPKTISDASRNQGRGLAPEETLCVPLRRPQHYRERWDQLLVWLSRRWLYNIPKSLRTEGLRPLGRLALVDHARQVCQRIRRAMLQAVEEGSVAATSQTIGREFRRDAARVYVIASISGGTGSGMVLDIAFAVRAMLEKLALPQVTVTGILLHSTGHDSRHFELARVNAFSTLIEFHHFHQPGYGYPGDASCGLPPLKAGTPAFDNSYLVDLGDSLSSSDYELATQTIADYLRLDALTPVQSCLDAGRRSLRDANYVRDAGSSLNLRSFGIHRRPTAPDGFCDEAASVVSSRLLHSWEGKSGIQGIEPADGAMLVQRLQLTSSGMAANAKLLIEAQLAAAAGQRELCESKFSSLRQTIAGIMEPLTAKLRSEVRRWVLQKVDEPRQRLSGAISANDWLRKHLDSAAAECRHAGGNFSELDCLATAAANDMCRTVLSDVESLARELMDFGKELGQMASTIENSCGSASPTGIFAADKRGSDSIARGVVAIFEASLGDVLAEVENRLQHEYLDKQGGLFRVVTQGGRPRAQLAATLQAFARQAVQNALARPNANDFAASVPVGDATDELAAATPAWLEFGGARRTIAVVPKEMVNSAEANQLATMLGTEVSVVPESCDGIVLCVEAEQLSLPHVALQIVQNRRDSVEFAERVQSRTDICWANLLPRRADSILHGRESTTVPVVADHALRQTRQV